MGKTGIVIAVSASCLLLAVAGWIFFEGSNPAGRKTGPPLVNQGMLQFMPAPDFTLDTLDGSTASLSDYRGTVVILDFWATW